MESVSKFVPVSGLGRTIGGVVFLLVGAVALYYLYQYMFTTQGITSTSIITTAIPGNVANSKSYTIPQPYEGGEYSVGFWAYITDFKDTGSANKHILEIRGVNFSTLVVGLGSFTNKLIVRTHTGVCTSATAGCNNTDLTIAPVPNKVAALFTTPTVPNSLHDTNTLCDLPEIDLQRWVYVTVVLNGKTCDVYMDGKLARSCVLPAVYKADTKGMTMMLVQYGGFNGYLGDVTCYSYAINPDQIYRTYMSGPTTTAGGSGFMGWLSNMFNVSGTVNYSIPSVGITRTSSSVTF